MWQNGNLPTLPQKRTTPPWMLFRMRRWLPFTSGGVLFSVFPQPYHTNWELFVLLLIVSREDESTLGTQPFQSTQTVCNSRRIYLLSPLLERPGLEKWPDNFHVHSSVLLLNYGMPQLIEFSWLVKYLDRKVVMLLWEREADTIWEHTEAVLCYLLTQTQKVR